MGQDTMMTEGIDDTGLGESAIQEGSAGEFGVVNWADDASCGAARLMNSAPVRLM